MSSGFGPNWPSRLGKIKIKRTKPLMGSVDVLEDSNEENDNIKGKLLLTLSINFTRIVLILCYHIEYGKP